MLLPCAASRAGCNSAEAASDETGDGDRYTCACGTKTQVPGNYTAALVSCLCTVPEQLNQGSGQSHMVLMSTFCSAHKKQMHAQHLRYAITVQALLQQSSALLSKCSA